MIQPPILAKEKPLLKLDLACGQNCKDGFEGVDLAPGVAKYQCNLLEFPWQWEDNSVEELHCSHFIEHIPMAYIDSENNISTIPTPDSRDMLFAFFDECYRILVPGGKMTVVTPCARNNRAFQDPTHRRFIVAETFLYLSAEWRKLNKLDHYNVNCNFGVNVVPTIPQEFTLYSPERQAVEFNTKWNTVIDWYATLIAIKDGQNARR